MADFKPIEVIIPKTKEDLKRCEELDRVHKLAHVGSYPSVEDFEIEKKRKNFVNRVIRRAKKE